MLTISQDDYRTLELRIQKEVQKVFLQFLDDLEHRTAGSGDQVNPHEGGTSSRSEPVLPHHPEARKRSRGRSRKSVETMMRLQGIAPEPSHTPRSTLDNDMEKILKFKKPQKKRTPGTGR